MRTERCSLPVETPVRVKTDTSIIPEGYRLDVLSEGTITITSSDAAGEFYARQTLKQLLDWRGYQCATIEDAPAYRWRGMMIDDCRHFFGKAVVKNLVGTVPV